MKGRTGTLATLACGFVAFGLAGSIAAVLWASGSSTRVPQLPSCRTLGISCGAGHLGPGFAQRTSGNGARAGVGPASSAVEGQQGARPSEAVGATAPSTAGRPEQPVAKSVALTDRSAPRTSSGSRPTSATLTSQDSPLPRAPESSAAPTSHGSRPASATLTSQGSPSPRAPGSSAAPTSHGSPSPPAHASPLPAASSAHPPRPLAPPPREHATARPLPLSRRHVMDRHRSRSHGVGVADAGPVSRRDAAAGAPPPPPRHVVTPATRRPDVSKLGVPAGGHGPPSPGTRAAHLGRVPLRPSTPRPGHPARGTPLASGITAGVAGNAGAGNAGAGNGNGGKAGARNGNTNGGNTNGGNGNGGNGNGG